MSAAERVSSDPGARGQVLQSAWRALAHRAAVAGGCAAAIVSLRNHVPLSTVALRGGLAWMAILVTTQMGWWALVRALSLEARRHQREAEQPPE